MAIGWAGTVLVLIADIPVFLGVSPWPDTPPYDVAARNAFAGGVPFPIAFDANLPAVGHVNGAKVPFHNGNEITGEGDQHGFQ